MCKFITEEELLGVMLNPPSIKSLLLLTEGIDIVSMQFGSELEDANITYSYLKVTKKELFNIGLSLLDRLGEEEKELALENLKELNIHASLWYKYYEDKMPSISNHTLKENSIMEKNLDGTFTATQEELDALAATRARAILEAGRTHWEKHGGKYKKAFFMFLGACVGAGAMAYADRRGSNQASETTGQM